MTVTWALVLGAGLLLSLFGMPGVPLLLALLGVALAPKVVALPLVVILVAAVAGEVLALRWTIHRGVPALRALVAYGGAFLLFGKVLGALLGSGLFVLLFGEDVQSLQAPFDRYLRELLKVRAVRVLATLLVGIGFAWMASPAAV